MSFLFLSLLQYHLQWDIYQQATIIITTSVDFQVNLDQMLPSWFHLLQKRTVGDSDVTIIDINIEIAIFKENQMESISEFFGASVARFWYSIALEGPAINAGGHRMGFTPHGYDHTECGVYISTNPIMLSAKEFTSSTLNEYWGDKSKLNQNQIV